METFTTTTQLTKKAFTNYLYGDVYSRPYYIIVSAFGLFLFITGIYYLNGYPELDSYTELRLGAGAFLLIVPTINILIAVRNSFANPVLNGPITYTFSNGTVNVKAATAEATISWVNILKVKETRAFLALYISKKNLHLVGKDGLSREQINFILAKAKRK